MRLITRGLLVIAATFLLGISQVYAFTLRLSEQDLNQIVKMTFPQTQYYQGIKVVFSDPQLTLSANNKVAVDVNLLGTQNGQQLEAKAKMSGELLYDGSKGELQIIRPALNDFHVLNSNLASEKEILAWAEQIKGQSAPLILLLNVKDMNLSILGNRLPREMRVESGQLVVDF